MWIVADMLLALPGFRLPGLILTIRHGLAAASAFRAVCGAFDATAAERRGQIREFVDCGGLGDRIEVGRDLCEAALAVGCCAFSLWEGLSGPPVVAGHHYWRPGLRPAMTKERGGRDFVRP